MARDMVPVLKRCRALGIEPMVMGLDKKSKRTAGNGRRKISEYGAQLREKQKAKFIYGVLEKPFRNNFARAKKLKYGTTGENLMILLELRLDNVIFRLGLARTRKEARQMVGHKMVLVNGKQVNIPSYNVAVGDKIEIKEKKKSIQRVKDVLEATNGRLVPAWLEMDRENLTAIVKEIPTRDQIDVPVDEVFIVELYSK
nr:30S ribosomal protein S4 [uncultured Catonella sp.]